MTDQRYEIMLKNLDRCGNCTSSFIYDRTVKRNKGKSAPIATKHS